MRQNVLRQGFTLIELLIVITIIAILAGILLPVTTMVLRKGFESRARTEMKGIETAVKAYMNEYGKLPVADDLQGSEDVVVSSEAASVILALAGDNPRRITFLEVDNNSGAFPNPWGTPYEIIMDTDYNNLIGPPVIPAEVRNQVVVRTRTDEGALLYTVRALED